MIGDGRNAGGTPDAATAVPDSDAPLLPEKPDAVREARRAVPWRAFLMLAGGLGIVGACAALFGGAAPRRGWGGGGAPASVGAGLRGIESLRSVESAPPRGLASCTGHSEDECVKQVGCRWFQMEKPCPLCQEWLGDEVHSLTGCRDWCPWNYCRDQIFFHILNKHKALKPRDKHFIDAMHHFHVVQGTGAVGGPHKKVMKCDVWCDSKDCEGQARMSNTLQGVNYGGRFVPEEFLGLYGTGEYLFKGAKKHNGSRALTPCDIDAGDAGSRMSRFLDDNIKKEHFATMSQLGFNTVRLPVGYWNLVDLPDTPDGPPETKARWKNLQRFMKAGDYKKWIDMVFDFAKQSGLKVLMDLHSAPGGQSGNECTGCDMGPTDAIFFLSDAEGKSGLNLKYAVQAVERMAEICAEKGDTCYGIELLNEPYGGNRDANNSLDMLKDLATCEARHMEDCTGIKQEFTSAQLSDVASLIGELYLPRMSNKTKGPTARPTYRRFLRDFYGEAIKKARAHIKPDKPIVIMDWAAWLEWWKDNAQFPYAEYGHIVFATHVYVFDPVTTDLPSAKTAMGHTFDTLRNFTLQSGYELLVTEYALNSHGSGQKEDYFDYNDFLNWYVHQLTQLGLGSMIWNFDSYWKAWGSVASDKVGNSHMDWKAINTVYGASSSPGMVVSVSSP